MSDLKHTKGPWEAGKPNADQWSILSNGIFICMLPTNTKEALANAKLIAAAPELLEALQKCSPVIDQLINQTASGTYRNELCDLNILLKTVIQKATT